MSFIITMYVREGIVMASDSRLTLTAQQQQQDGKQTVQVAVGQSDSNYKTFLAPHDIGVSIYGAAEIKGVPIAGYIESFIDERLSGDPTSVDGVPQKLLEYFGQFQPAPDTQFHVAGYKEEGGQKDQQVWHVSVAQNKVSRLNPPGKQGASWAAKAIYSLA